MEATAALWFVENSGQPPFLLGLVTSVLPGEINVPREWLTLLQGLQTDRRIDPGLRPLDEPRFRVTVRWGRNLDPWVANVQPMPMLPSRPADRDPLDRRERARGFDAGFCPEPKRQP